MIHAAGMKVIAGTAISLLAFLSPCAYAQDTGFYEYKKASRDGIGKFYMGREISHVMGHLGAAWLERPQRDREEKTSRLVKNLPLESDDTVADIGAGTGYFSFRIADRIQQGKVLAVDIQQEMLDVIQSRIAEGFPKNVEPVLGTERDPRLAAESIDLVLLVDAYHEFSHPVTMLDGIRCGLKKEGLVALVEFRSEDLSVPIKPDHKMSKEQILKEFSANGFKLVRSYDKLPWQHLMFFKRMH